MSIHNNIRQGLIAGAVALSSCCAFADGLSGSVSPQLGGGISSGFDGGINGGGSFLPGAAIDMNFQTGQYFGRFPADLTVVRASNKTDLLPTSPSGFVFTTFGNNIAAITSGLGLSVEESRTNQLLNSTVPATQTTGILAATAQTLWVNGSGTATLSNGIATGCVGVATNGVPVTFTPTIGTCIVTVTGSLNAFQLEAGIFGTSLIVTAAATATRAADVITLTSPPAFGAAYSMFAKGTPQASGATVAAQNPLSISDNSNNNRFVARRNGTPFGEHLVLVTGGAANINADMSTAAWGNVSGKIAFAGAAGDQKAAFNGTLDTNSYASPMPVGVNTVYIGTSATGDVWWNGFIERIALWPATRITNTQLQSITQ